MKSRGVYETPGGTILLVAHRAIESITLDRALAHLKDELMPRYAELIYNGFWFSPEREMLQALIDKTQESVNGTRAAEALQGPVQRRRPQVPELALPPGLRHLRGRHGVYDQKDAEGFIKLNALRLRLGAMAKGAGGREEALSGGLASVAVFCGGSRAAKPVHVDAATRLGRALAARGIRLVYGGGRIGLDGALADAALASGGDRRRASSPTTSSPARSPTAACCRTCASSARCTSAKPSWPSWPTPSWRAGRLRHHGRAVRDA